MTKAELIREISNIAEEEVNQKQVGAVLTALETVVRNAVIADDEVTVPGICKVKAKEVKEKTGTIMLGANKGNKYTKPAHKEGSVKIVSSLKKVFE